VIPAIHRLVTLHIGGIGDVYLMIEQGAFATTERFGLESAKTYGSTPRLQRRRLRLG
jgi:hypothetical protein